MTKIKAVLPDLLLVAGGGGVTWGAYLAWAPSGFIVGGALAIIAGLQLARAD